MKQTTKQLVEELRTIAKEIEDGESYEGHLNYSCLEDWLEKDEWEVDGVYRTVNGVKGIPISAMKTMEKKIKQ